VEKGKADATKAKTAAAKKAKENALTGTVPEWANSTAIAQLLGKSLRRVQQMTQEGILQTEVPPGGGGRKYRTCETIQRYMQHVEQKANENGNGGKQSELALKKLEAEIGLKESQGELHKLRTDIAKGRFIPAEQAQEQMADFMIIFRKFTDAIPSRMSGIMAAYTDLATARTMEKSMKKEMDGMLSLFAAAAKPEETEE
jgi:hypothetical protein